MTDKKSFLRQLIIQTVTAMLAAAVTIIVMNCCNANRSAEATVIMPDIKIYIRGEINSPGLYEIGADIRLCEFIDIAGGATENADLERLNLAAILTDGTTVEIPAVGSEKSVDPMIAQTNQAIYQAGTSASQITPASDKITSGSININTASATELMRLPGVGQATADKIISYRQSSGGFMSIEEIMNVSGIGEKKFEAMKPFLAVE